jgi:hypothetical protein
VLVGRVFQRDGAHPGRLVSKAAKTFAGPFKLPYADKWTVVWRTAKGEKFEGRLVFTIDANNNLSYITESLSST